MRPRHWPVCVEGAACPLVSGTMERPAAAVAAHTDSLAALPKAHNNHVGHGKGNQAVQRGHGIGGGVIDGLWGGQLGAKGWLFFAQNFSGKADSASQRAWQRAQWSTRVAGGQSRACALYA